MANLICSQGLIDFPFGVYKPLLRSIEVVVLLGDGQPIIRSSKSVGVLVECQYPVPQEVNFVMIVCPLFLSMQELDPLPDLIRRETLTESELEECKRVNTQNNLIDILWVLIKLIIQLGDSKLTEQRGSK